MTRVRRSAVVRPVETRPVCEGTPIERGVFEHRLKSRPIEVVGPTSDVWKMTEPEINRWVDAMCDTAAFVWLDPPGAIVPEFMVVRLLAAGIPYRVKKSGPTDNAMPECVVATPAEVHKTIWEVVQDMAVEAKQNLDEPTGVELDRILDEQLSAVGVCAS